MTLFPASELRRGDVLLWRRRLLQASLLRRLDGGRFDGAALCIEDGGGMVAAAAAEGVLVRPLQEWSERCEEIMARRFRGDDGRGIEEQGHAVKLVLDKARYYTERGVHYAHDDTVQLALVATLRRWPVDGWLPGLAGLFAELVQPAQSRLQELHAQSRIPLMAPAFAFRCYAETGLKYRVRTPRAPSAAVGSLGQLARLAYAKALDGAPLSAVERDLLDVHTLIQGFLGAYYAALGVDPQGVFSDRHEWTLPEIVTAADLEGSPNLVPLGRVV